MKNRWILLCIDCGYTPRSGDGYPDSSVKGGECLKCAENGLSHIVRVYQGKIDAVVKSVLRSREMEGIIA